MAKFTLANEITATLKVWVGHLRNLTFGDNFVGYEWQGTIPFGEEVRITHTLKRIPTRFLVLDAKGCNTIVRGDTPSTSQFFYLKNTGGGFSGSEDFSGKILIMP